MLLPTVLAYNYSDSYPYMYCQNRTCSTPYDKSKLKPIVDAVYTDNKEPHISIDFREAGLVTAARRQGDCNSSWAIATCDVAEILILRRNDDLGEDNYWKQFDNTSLDLSEQFVMMNDFGYSHYCDYGDPIRAASWISDELRSLDLSTQLDPPNTFELESHFPYDYEKYRVYWENKTQWDPNITKKHYMYPYELNDTTVEFADGKTWTWGIPAIMIFNSNNETFSNRTIALLKRILSLGLPITAKMRTIYNNTEDTVYMTNAGGEPIHRDCPPLTPYEPSFVQDHWVTIVGYGKKLDRPSWLVKDTRGPNWGDKGFFFVEIGKNSYCIETSAYTYMPKGFNTKNSRVTRGKNRFRLNTWDFDPDPECIEPEYPFYVTLGYCLSVCPETEPFADPLQEGLGMQCRARCEDAYPLYVIDWDQTQSRNCTSECPSPGLSYDDGTGAFRCVSACPESLPYVSEIQVGTAGPRLVCQANCTEAGAEFAQFQKVSQGSDV